MRDPICSVDGCDYRSRSRGWCSAHYMRWRKFGDPVAGGPLKRIQPKQICSIEDCGREVIGRGWCSLHYDHWHRWGDPHGSAPVTPDEERFWAKVEKSEGCWLWVGYKNRFGYPMFAHEARESFAHRYSYEMHYGKIPDGLEIDHQCHKPLCVRPDHLRAVTHKQNLEHRKGATVASSTGYLGVFRIRSGKYIASCGHFGVQYRRGPFATAEEANEAAVALRNELFTHNDRDRRRA